MLTAEGPRADVSGHPCRMFPGADDRACSLGFKSEARFGFGPDGRLRRPARNAAPMGGGQVGAYLGRTLVEWQDERSEISVPIVYAALDHAGRGLLVRG